VIDFGISIGYPKSIVFKVKFGRMDSVLFGDRVKG